MTTNEVIVLARKHVGSAAKMEFSARFCLAGAVSAQGRGDLVAARRWALKSLAYSVGIFHPDYQRGQK